MNLDDLYSRVPESTRGSRFSVVMMQEEDAYLVREVSTGVRVKVPAKLLVEVGVEEAFKRTKNKGNDDDDAKANGG